MGVKSSKTSKTNNGRALPDTRSQSLPKTNNCSTRRTRRTTRTRGEKKEVTNLTSAKQQPNNCENAVRQSEQLNDKQLCDKPNSPLNVMHCPKINTLSIDVGTSNIGVCVLGPTGIQYWDCLSITPICTYSETCIRKHTRAYNVTKEGVTMCRKCSKQCHTRYRKLDNSMETIAQSLMRTFATIPVDTPRVLIEHQPGFNKRMTAISMLMMGMFTAQYKEIHLVNPKLKVRKMEKYKDRKNESINRALELTKGTPWHDVLQSHTKKDDMADALNQALAWLAVNEQS